MDSGARIGLVSLGGGARKGGAGGGGGGDGAGGPGGSNVGGPTALGKRPKTTSEATTPIELKQLIVEYCTQAAGPSDEVLGTLDQATLTHMLEAFSKQDYAPVATALTELIVQLRDHPQAPRRNVIASLAALSVRRPEMFRLPPVLSVLYMCLSKEYTPSLKRVPLITGFACHLVYRTLDGVVDWPLELVQVPGVSVVAAATWGLLGREVLRTMFRAYVSVSAYD